MPRSSDSRTAPTIVSVDHVSKRFVLHKDKTVKERLLNPLRSRQHRDDFWALRDVTLDIAAGSTIGLIGPNGSGKSTLLKLIGGIIQPNGGHVLRRGRMAALLELGAGFHQDLTGRENVYLNASILGLSREQTDEYFDEIVEFSGIRDFIDTQVKFYSSGMYVRLAFAVAVHVDPDLLLVDEVLAVGDEAFQKKCLDKIQSFQEEGRTIVLVTHTLSQVEELCTRAVVLGHGNVIFDGNPTEAVALLRSGFKTLQDAEAAKEQILRERERDDELRALRDQVAITAVRTITPDGGVRPGGELHIDVDLRVDRPFDDWELGVSVTNGLGQMVTSTTSDRSGLAGTILDGSVTLRFTLPELYLGNGQHTVTAALFDGHARELGRVADAAPFLVAADERSVGPMYTPAVATIQQA